MAIEENKALVRRYIEALWNGGDPTAIATHTATGYNFVLAGAPAPLDRPGLQRFVATFHTAFPDLHVTVEQLVGEGDDVAARWHARGTHRGTLLGIAPTGKAVTWAGVTLYRVVGDTIAADWNSADFLGLLQQLGVVPPLALAGA